MLSRLRSSFAFGCLIASGVAIGALLCYRGLRIQESMVYVFIVLVFASVIMDALSHLGRRR